MKTISSKEEIIKKAFNFSKTNTIAFEDADSQPSVNDPLSALLQGQSPLLSEAKEQK